MAARVGVVLFPGSNCELDAMEAVRDLGGDAEILWHGDRTVASVDAVIVPGASLTATTCARAPSPGSHR